VLQCKVQGTSSILTVIERSISAVETCHFNWKRKLKTMQLEGKTFLVVCWDTQDILLPEFLNHRVVVNVDQNWTTMWHTLWLANTTVPMYTTATTHLLEQSQCSCDDRVKAEF
jgi:hypothetical protein